MAATVPWKTFNLAEEEVNSSDCFKSLMKELSSNRRLIIVTGAGISITAGIPDFRSPGGLYERVSHRYAEEMAKEKKNHATGSKLVQSKLPVLKGQEFFDAGFLQNPATRPLFFRLMAELRDDCRKAEPTECHSLLADLIKEGKALRWYTQNIDDLEERTGLISTERLRAESKSAVADKTVKSEKENSKPSKVVQTTLPIVTKKKSLSPPVVCLHGTLSRVHCTVCRWSGDWTGEVNATFHSGEGPACPACTQTAAKRQAQGQRPLSTGILRPAIILYSEQHPHGDQLADLVTSDVMAKPTGMIVLGTSMRVPGLKRLVKDMAKAVHANAGPVIHVNLQPVRSVAEWRGVFDYELIGDCDGWSRLMRPHLLKPTKQEKEEVKQSVKVKQEEEMKGKVKEDLPSELKGEVRHRLPFKQQKSAAATAPVKTRQSAEIKSPVFV